MGAVCTCSVKIRYFCSQALSCLRKLSCAAVKVKKLDFCPPQIQKLLYFNTTKEKLPMDEANKLPSFQ